MVRVAYGLAVSPMALARVVWPNIDPAEDLLVLLVIVIANIVRLPSSNSLAALLSST